MPLDRTKQAHELIDALNARDFDALATLPFDPEFEFRSAVAAVEGEAFGDGVEGLRKWADTIDATFDGFQAKVVEVEEVGDDQAVVVFHVTGTAKASGFRLDERLAQVWTWRNERLWRNEVYADPREAFRAVGVRD